MARTLDDDTMRTIASGRQTAMSVLSNAQGRLKRVFLLFATVFLLTFLLLRRVIWDRLQADLVFNQMSPETAQATEIVVTDPFNVILLQTKIGLVVGTLVSLPLTIWYGRSGLKRRGYWPSSSVPRWKLVAFGIAVALLFVGGVAYAYFVFFPVMFKFLASIAINAGFTPTWSIVMWTDFVFFLSLSFGLAAQLPLAMSASARTGVVPYETFRDNWRYAVVGIFVFGAVFSPPDPFTQFMWGVPLVALYFISLGVTKFAVLAKQAGDQVSTAAITRDRWNVLAGSWLAAGLAVYAYLLEGGLAATNDLLARVGVSRRLPTAPDLAVGGLSPTVVGAAAGIVAGLLATAVVLFYLRIAALERLTADERTGVSSLDLAAMDATAVRAAPLERIAELDQDQAVAHAERAVDNNRPKKARAILDRLDAAEAAAEAEERDESAADETDEETGVVTSTTAGMIDPFTDDETTEDDIGGYYYDLAFILDSLTSKAFWLVGLFMTMLSATFLFLYYGGIEVVVESFLQNMPAEMKEAVDIVLLHPVEQLIFMIKFSTAFAALSVLPLALYFAWPAIEQRGVATGDRNVLLAWGGTLMLALIGGSILGFLVIGPTIISALARDALTSNMIIAYRINSFGWLVTYLTVGIGLLAMVPMTMVLFHHGSIVSFGRMRRSWRGVVFAVFVVAGVFSPGGLFTMFMIAVPTAVAYVLGLGLLWVYDRIGRAVPRGRTKTAD